MTKLRQTDLVSRPGLLRWSASIGAAHDLSELVDEDLQAISEQTGETITLALYDAVTGSAHIEGPGQAPGTSDMSWKKDQRFR